MILKKQLEDGNYKPLAIQGAVIMLLLSVFNLLKSFEEGLNIIQTLYLIIPFFVISGLYFILSSKNYIYLTLLIGGLYAAIDQSNAENFSGAGLLFYMYGLYSNKRHGIFVVSVSIVCICIRVLIYNLGFFGGMKLILAFSVVYLFGYWIFIKNNKRNEYCADYSNTDIEKQYIDIMKLYLQGNSWNEISSLLQLNVTGKSVQRSLDNEWKRRNFKNREQFAHFLGQRDIITIVDKNVITD